MQQMKSIFITGAASGIGRATALYFANEGWFTGLFDIDEEKLGELHAEIGRDKSCYKYCDITDLHSISKAADFFLHNTVGKIHVILNNAGIYAAGNFSDIPHSQQLRMIDINLKGYINCINVFYEHLRITGDSRIINMSSASAIHGFPYEAVNSATKAGICGLTEALQIEFESDDIYVCDILPNYVRTPLLENLTYNPYYLKSRGARLNPEDVARIIWKAAHRRKTHWTIGKEVGFLKLIVRLFPQIGRQVIRKITLPGDRR